MKTVCAYSQGMAAYRFATAHPMMPERFTLAVDLMSAWGLLGEEVPRESAGRAEVLRPDPSEDADLTVFHTPTYVAHVKAASEHPERVVDDGLGLGDTPAFAGMHDAAALAVGGTTSAVDAVLHGRANRAFAPAGGLHHAQRDRASGFCIYNDVAVAIELATRSHPGIRVAYVDIDGHHGDGVEAAFVDRADVLTLSVHESGRYLFPGTGRSTDIGEGAGIGCAVNVPLPPYAGPECYEVVASEVLVPALRAYAPDLIVAQIGGDSHRGDPLTHLYQSVGGFLSLVARIISLADELTKGRIVLTGGGGYQPFSEVPRMWAGSMALLLGRPVPEELPAEWLELAASSAVRAGHEPSEVTRTLDERIPDAEGDLKDAALQGTWFAVKQTLAASPLLGGAR